MIPTLKSYCDRTTPGNAMCVTIGPLDLYFSYTTPVAYRYNGELVCSSNVWSNTTGKHLNAICHKSSRIPHDEFTRRLAAICETLRHD